MKRSVIVVFALLLIFQYTLLVFAAVGPISKTPNEVIDLSLDFTPRAPNGITLLSVQVTKAQTGADVTNSMVVQSPQTPPPQVIVGTNKVYIRLQGGTIGDRCNVAIRVSRADTMEYVEGDITLNVVQNH